jgi:hypothetical protein
MPLSNLEKWLDEGPPEYPVAVIRLIDALYDYLCADVQIGQEFLAEGYITQVQFDAAMETNKPMFEALARLKKFELDPNLMGIIKRKD